MIKIPNMDIIHCTFALINQILPFVLFLLIPLLYNQTNGYSVIISLIFSAFFSLISSKQYFFLLLFFNLNFHFKVQSWLELQSRFKFQHFLYSRKNQNSNCKINIFKSLETTLGLNVAIMISILIILEEIAIYCVIIKWFFEDITNHFFHFLDKNHQHSECKINNISLNESLIKKTFNHEQVLFKSKSLMTLIQITFSIFYFVMLILPSRLSIKQQSKIRELFSKKKSKIFNIIFGVFFIILICSLLSQTLSLNSSKLVIKCETSFKNSFQSVRVLSFLFLILIFLKIFSGLAFCSAGFFYQLKFDSEKRQKIALTKLEFWKNSLISPKFRLIAIKIVSVVIISLCFIFLLNTFTPFRLLCCTEFYESFLNHPDHGVHIFKKLCFIFVCFYIFFLSHKSVKYSEKVLTKIFTTLFYDINNNNNKDESSIDSVDTQTEEILIDKRKKSEKNYKYLFPSENNSEYYSIFVLCLLSLFFLIFLTKHDLFIFWTISFLVLNLRIVSSVLLVNYFPYQVLVESNTSKAIFFKNKESCPLIKQHFEKTKIYNQNIKEKNELSGYLEEQSIDQIFAEHLGELKTKALSDKDLSFGEKQPNMKSAYKAIIGFISFFVCCIFFNLVFNFFKIDFKEWKNFSYFISLLFGLISFKIIVVIFFLIKNERETIYIKQIKEVSIFLPFNQLLITFFTVFLIFRFDSIQIMIFISIYFIILIFFLVYFKIFSMLVSRRIKKLNLLKNLNFKKNSNIFVIN